MILAAILKKRPQCVKYDIENLSTSWKWIFVMFLITQKWKIKLGKIYEVENSCCLTIM